MERYKLLNAEGYSSGLVIEGAVYAETDEVDATGGWTVEKAVKQYPEDWELVEESGDEGRLEKLGEMYVILGQTILNYDIAKRNKAELKSQIKNMCKANNINIKLK